MTIDALSTLYPGFSEPAFLGEIYLLLLKKGKPVRIIVSAGQEADCTYAPPLMAGVSVKVLLADRRYDVNYVVDTAHSRRHLIENVFRWLKQWRGIATRYAQRSDSFLAALYLRSIFLPFDDTPSGVESKP
ncbi:MAG: hypothetical protein LBO67_09580 [Spirochaetaceae bacterium]|jgi:transposase|nr:hypothetical protein [Spirochaetaceae bacterium]